MLINFCHRLFTLIRKTLAFHGQGTLNEKMLKSETSDKNGYRISAYFMKQPGQTYMQVHVWAR